MDKAISHKYAPMTKISNSLTRNFAYTLSDKKAITNLLKSASREALEVDEKQKCVNYNLSVGAYMHVVFPLLQEWKNSKASPNAGTLLVKEIISGFDDQKRHVDTVVHFTYNGLKATVTAYNTTQKL